MGDIEARREARRRKILENAENRMRKITNSVGKPDDKPLKYTSAPPVIDEATNSFVAEIQNIIPLLKENTAEFLSNSSSYINAINSDLIDSGIGEDNHVEETPLTCNSTRNDSNRIFIKILLAVLFRLLILFTEKFNLFNENVEFLYKIFIPLFLYELIEVLFFNVNNSSQFTNSSMLNAIFLLNNIPKEHGNKFLFVLYTISKMIQDISIYFYAFVIADYICNFL